MEVSNFPASLALSLSRSLYSDGSLFRAHLFRLRPQLELSPT